MPEESGSGVWAALAKVILSARLLFRVATPILLTGVFGSQTIDYFVSSGLLKAASLPYTWMPWVFVLAAAALITLAIERGAQLLGQLCIRAYESFVRWQNDGRLSRSVEDLREPEKAILRCFLDQNRRDTTSRMLMANICGPPYSIPMDQVWRHAQWLRDAGILDGPAPSDNDDQSQWWVRRDVWRVLWTNPELVGSKATKRKHIYLDRENA